MRMMIAAFVLVMAGNGWSIESPSFESTDIKRTTENELMEASRQSRFQDSSLDELHGRVNSHVQRLIQVNGVIEEELKPGNLSYIDYNVLRDYRFYLTTGTDGRRYLRVYLGHGDNKFDLTNHHKYIYSIYGYFYLGDDGKISEVVFQFYRVTYLEGEPTYREFRRIIHPSPTIFEGEMGDRALLNWNSGPNDGITIEYYDNKDRTPPFPIGDDGIPMPERKMKPIITTALNDKEHPVPYEVQMEVLSTYRKLLNRANYRLKKKLRIIELERPRLIKKALEYNS